VRIQTENFPGYPGAAMQTRLKDKWKVLCNGYHKRASVRSALPDNVWQRIGQMMLMHASRNARQPQP